ncbi:MAG: hypothetical protein IT379_39495 [Deltaproteobacteria bacterium]|nr:hypothetical protein [Deltaproteobacteria bacterium]
MPTQEELLDVLGIEAPRKPAKRKARGTPRARDRFPEPDDLRWPRSLHEPLAPRQAALWREVLEGLCDEVLGEWRGPRCQGVERGWPSLHAALLTFAARRSYDPSASALGRQLAALEGGTVGCGSHRSDGTETALVRGMSSTPIERALLEAYRPAAPTYEARQGLRYEKCVELLVEAVCGLPEVTKRSYRRVVKLRELAAVHGLAEHAVHAVVEHGRRVVVVELAARDLLPMPDPRTGLLQAIRARADELREHGE